MAHQLSCHSVGGKKGSWGETEAEEAEWIAFYSSSSGMFHRIALTSSWLILPSWRRWARSSCASLRRVAWPLLEKLNMWVLMQSDGIHKIVCLSVLWFVFSSYFVKSACLQQNTTNHMLLLWYTLQLKDLFVTKGLGKLFQFLGLQEWARKGSSTKCGSFLAHNLMSATFTVDLLPCAANISKSFANTSRNGEWPWEGYQSNSWLVRKEKLQPRSECPTGLYTSLETWNPSFWPTNGHRTRVCTLFLTNLRDSKVYRVSDSLDGEFLFHHYTLRIAGSELSILAIEQEEKRKVQNNHGTRFLSMRPPRGKFRLDDFLSENESRVVSRGGCLLFFTNNFFIHCWPIAPQ